MTTPGDPLTPEELAVLTNRPEPGPHHTTIEIDGQPTETLADLPPLRDRLLFVGLNPSPVSVTAGHYHQGRLGRSFWRRLKTAGLIPRGTELEWADDALLAAGHGITDLLKIPTPRDEASDAALRAGVGPLWQKIAIWRPAAVVFIYKRGATISAGRQLTESWGQLEGVALAGRPCFLMPGPYAPTEQVHEGLNFLRNLAAALPADRN
jgi:TDG/mug DNA glycosylase family protein